MDGSGRVWGWCGEGSGADYLADLLADMFADVWQIVGPVVEVPNIRRGSQTFVEFAGMALIASLNHQLARSDVRQLVSPSPPAC